MADVDKNIGRLIGNYRVLAEIGSGGFGKVYQGQHIFLTERIVAIKFLHTHLSTGEEREQFLQEARFLEKLKHPYMLHVFDVGIDDGFPYLVTEFAPEKSLRNRMKQHTPGLLAAQEVLTILSQVGQALASAHQQHIIHRDLKPENILFNARGEALLSDFGIATTLSTASVKSVSFIGTPLYMAPEQFQGIISKESDQYALGCIAYELVTGRTPFTAPDFYSLGFQHLSAAPVPPTQYNPDLPAHIEQAILKALAKQRTERHADVPAFIRALHTPVRFQTGTATIPAAAPVAQSAASYVVEDAPTIGPTGSSETPRQSGAWPSHENDGRNTSAVSSTNTQPVRYQAPVTPLPPVWQTPSSGQAPMTPFPPINDSGQFGGDESPTFISRPEEGENRQQSQKVPASAGSSSAAAGRFITPPPINTTLPGKVRSKRAFMLFAAICILLIASVIGVLVFVLPSNPSTPGITTSRSTPTTAPGQTATNPMHNPTQSGPNNPVASATHRTTSTSLTGPTVTPTPVIKPSPVATSTPTTGFSPTPIPTVDPTLDPTPAPTSESLTVPFTSTGTPTANSYGGMVTISVNGVGQAGSTKYSDAFYYYIDASGTPMAPVHPSCWVLYINNQPIDDFISVPPYNPNHSYTFQINVPTGQITFNVCDTNHSDNTGQYYITVTQN